MISIIYPIKDNLDLLKQTINSIAIYTKDIRNAFEIILLNEDLDEEIESYVETLKTEFDLSYIRYKSPYESQYFNPAFVINLGVNLSKYNSIVISSPHIIHKTPAIKQFIELIGKNVLGEVVEIDKNNEIIQVIVGSNVPTRSNDPGMYFLAMFNKSDFLEIGGIDEDFMYGRGYEDRDFGRRFKAKFKFEVLDEIKGIHLHHSRPPNNSQGCHKNGQLWKNRIGTDMIIANKNRVFGNTNQILYKI